MQPITGVAGGSEHWEYRICDWWLGQQRNLHLFPDTPRAVNDLRDRLNELKREVDVNGRMDFLLNEGDALHGTVYRVSIASNIVRDKFDEALGPPLEVAEEQIRCLAEFNKAVTRVIVSGGTSHIKHLQGILRQACRSNGIPDPHFVRPEWNVNYE